MNNENKRALIKAFDSYVDAHTNLSKLLEDYTNTVETDYPFDESFDDLLLQVMTWRDTQSILIDKSMSGTVLEEIGAFEKNATGDFKLWLQWIKEAGILNEVTETSLHYSGGGMEHFMLRLKDGRIIIIHLFDEFIDLSFFEWPSIDAYISDDNERGFGFEQNFGDVELRCLDMTLENFNQIITQYKNTVC